MFVVMMLDIDFVELRRGFLSYLPIGALIGMILLVELVLLFGAWVIPQDAPVVARSTIPPVEQVTNPHTLEIGRAACRERVCQYESISVVAVSLKKKKKNTQ